MPVEREILIATKSMSKREDEADQKYFARLIRKTNRLPDDEWDNLSEKAQLWVNTGIESMNVKTSIDDFPDIDEVGREASSKSDKKGTRLGAKLIRGGTIRFRELILEHSDWSIEKAYKEVKKAGFSLAPSTAGVMFYEMKACLKVLKKMNKLKS